MNTPPSAPIQSRYGTYDPDYWRQRFLTEPYRDADDRFEDFEPAYRFGYSLRGQLHDIAETESDWEARWNEIKAECRLSWDKAKSAIRAAWQHTEKDVKSDIQSAMERCEAKMCVAVQRFKDNIRRQPGDYFLGAMAAGYAAGRLPLRSIAMTGIAVTAAAAPMGAILWGLYKAADHYLARKAPLETRPRAVPPPSPVADGI